MLALHSPLLPSLLLLLLPTLSLNTPPPTPTPKQQAERQAAAEALVAALVDSQKQYDATHRAKGDNPGGTLEQLEAGGNRQQRMEECLSCCSPLMVRDSYGHTLLF